MYFAGEAFDLAVFGKYNGLTAVAYKIKGKNHENQQYIFA